MKLPFSWLKEYLDLPYTIDRIADALTMAGLEVEGVEKRGTEEIFEIGLTPNLGHCLSVLGIARELSAILDIPLKKRDPIQIVAEEQSDDPLSLVIEAPDACLEYTCCLVDGVQVGPSPSWLVERLEACGLRSVNIVVDIGNFVMLECGQPIHLFDFDTLRGKEIRVSKSNSSDGMMLTLDGCERRIPEGALLIRDGEKGIAFAGVIGSLETAISEKTVRVVVEVAHFTPEAIRKTAKLIGNRSDSSTRFERGTDRGNLEFARKRVAELLCTHASGRIRLLNLTAYGSTHSPQILTIDCSRANSLLGTSLSVGEIITLLGRLQISLLSELHGVLTLSIPSYRTDIKGEIDLIEEVGRIYGFNHIPKKIPRFASSKIPHSPLFLLQEQARNLLMKLGLQECLTCDLISPKLAALVVENSLPLDAHIHVLHPASIDQSVLRPSLLPSLLEVVKFNIDRQTEDLAIFEVGHVHFKEGDKYIEVATAGIVLSGKALPYHFEQKEIESDFFRLKGIVESFLTERGINIWQIVPSHLHNFHPGRQGRVKIGDRLLGTLGEVHPRILKAFGIDGRVYYAELDLFPIAQEERERKKVKELSPFPGSERDWTIVVDERTSLGELLEPITSLPFPLLERAFLLDLYRSEKIGEGKKSVTIRFIYRDPKRTVEGAEVEAVHTKVTECIAKKLANRVP